MESVGIAVIGLGIMGSQHAAALARGAVAGGHLVAVCDSSSARLDADGSRFGRVAKTTEPTAVISNPDVEAVVVATPHYSHVPIGIQALEHGRHLMLEKPVAPHKALCDQMAAAAARTDLVYAVMFNQRTNPRYRTLRSMIIGGELGPLRRINWTVTDWFRTEAYYRSSEWRATWAGEGGGVLLNQSPHQLDILQWLGGMPSRVTAFCEFGRYHDIEVEDDVTAYLEYENGCRGVFVTTTGESPGTNRLEVTGELAKVVIDLGTDETTISRNDVAMSAFAATAAGGFDRPRCSNEVLRFEGEGGQHVEVLANFCAAIRSGEPLIGPGIEGAHSVELANAMLMSAFTDGPVALPIDADRYAELLRARMR